MPIKSGKTLQSKEIELFPKWKYLKLLATTFKFLLSYTAR